MKKLLATLAVSLFAITSAQAAELADLDKDADGMVSMEEAKAAMPDLSVEKFQAADADGDGKLSVDELASLKG